MSHAPRSGNVITPNVLNPYSKEQVVCTFLKDGAGDDGRCTRGNLVDLRYYNAVRRSSLGADLQFCVPNPRPQPVLKNRDKRQDQGGYCNDSVARVRPSGIFSRYGSGPDLSNPVFVLTTSENPVLHILGLAELQPQSVEAVLRPRIEARASKTVKSASRGSSLNVK
jgi:hypothetical protein